MKCLDKKRIKMKGGETLALNERIMLSLVSTGVSTVFNLLSIHTLISIHPLSNKQEPNCNLTSVEQLESVAIWY